MTNIFQEEWQKRKYNPNSYLDILKIIADANVLLEHDYCKSVYSFVCKKKITNPKSLI